MRSMAAIHSVGDECLAVHDAVHVPALVVVVVERLEVDVARMRIGAGETREIRQPNAGSHGDGGPSFDAKMVEPVSGARQRPEIR
jgi:hypothetical protein